MKERRDAFLHAVATKPVIMGILNITPDSFSDGGKFNSVTAACQQAETLAREGADIIDIGAESTRPGATPVCEAEETARIEAILGAVRTAVDVPLSIDTSKANVARRAMALGADVINDVWGLQHDEAMAATVAETGAAVVIMHNRAEKDASLNIIDDMRRFFDHSLALAEAAGVPRHFIILDPGIGFGKTQTQNLEAIRGLGQLKCYGLPILAGISRKSLLGAVLGTQVHDRLIGSISAHLAAAAHGARIFRVHDVAEHVTALRVFEAIDHGHV